MDTWETFELKNGKIAKVKNRKIIYLMEKEPTYKKAHEIIKWTRANKEWWCNECHQSIKKGEYYYQDNFRYEADVDMLDLLWCNWDGRGWVKVPICQRCWKWIKLGITIIA
jgi:hypothetical protein